MKNNLLHLCIGLSIILVHHFVQSVLYPYESEVREIKTLNGLWYFTVLPKEAKLNAGIKDFLSTMYKTESLDDIYAKMPVPSSFNDITTLSSVRDHIGWVIYQREFYVPNHWKQNNNRVFVHFGGVHYTSFVVINEVNICEHIGGHIPFEVEITSQVKTGLNSIIVAVNNTLTNYSLPQGYVRHEHPDWHPTGFTTFSHNCDYFDYAGINRPVTLYTTPTVYICGITVETDFKGDTGYVSYAIKICGSSQEVDCRVLIYDKNKSMVAKSSPENSNSQSNGCVGKLLIENVKLWWPIMSKETTSPGYLYTLEVLAGDDIYRLPVGIRTIKWTNTSLLINNVPIYLKGFGMHEDSDIRGRGFDNAILARDMNLIKWLGANSFRTSHYPYADETLNEADSHGIFVILETPGCSLDNFDEKLLAEHKRILNEIIEHHKNRPSVIMWSLANEPNTNLNSSESYFRELVELSRAKDRTRPVTFVTSQRPDTDKAVKLVDIISFNRYNGWYQYSGQLDLIQFSVVGEVSTWYKNFSKPIILTEYGAGSYIGQHELPARMWSEEYQVLLLLEHFKAFDKLRREGYFIGEMIWNFIDFKVPQEYFRPGKCDKGLFTRDRQPKPAAFIVKERYHILTEEINETANITKKFERSCNSFNNVKVDLV